MLMHSCYCVFISVTGGFVQMLKDLKNLLKLSLKILFIKRKKRKFPSIPPFLRFGPLVFFFPLAQLLPAAQHRSQQPSSPSLPRSAQLRAQPSPAAARSAPARQLPRPAADARAPSVGAAPNLPHPAPAPGQGGTAATTRVVGASSRPSASLKGSRAPLARPPAAPAPFSPRPGRNCRTEEPRRPPSSPSASPSSPSRHRLRFSPVVSSPWSPLSPHAFLFEFRGFLAPFPQASASSWPSAMAAAAPTFPSGHLFGLAVTPFSPRALGCPRISVWRTLAPLTELAGVFFAAGHG